MQGDHHEQLRPTIGEGHRPTVASQTIAAWSRCRWSGPTGCLWWKRQRHRIVGRHKWIDQPDSTVGRNPWLQYRRVAFYGADQGWVRPEKMGGRFRAGIANGGPSDTLDPANAASGADFFRVQSLFEALTRTTPDIRTELLLAESIEPNDDGTEWAIRLREGVTFHDGKSLTIDDVIHTFMRTKEVSNVGRTATAVMDFEGIKRLDDLTIRVPLTKARAEFPADLASIRIIQEGAGNDAFANPIGTGPFSFVSLTPGQNSLFERNANYWQDEGPYLDELEFITIADGSARVNALQGGQVDAADQVLYTQAREFENSSDVIVSVSEPGNWVPITMACDTPRLMMYASA